MTENEILKDATEDQKEAIKYINGPCFVVAGPGSGKTKVIVSRTQYMIKNHIDPSSIVLFTFTCKAANEIKDRVNKAVGKDSDKILSGTYHSICSKFLRKYADRLGYTKKFSIYDTDDQKSVLKDIINSKDLDVYNIISYISDMKNKLISPDKALNDATTDIQSSYALYYKKYQNRLKKNNAMDFDDLIYNAIKLFEENKDVLEKINNKYKYITADEYHDSSNRDVKLIQLLAGENQNVCLILDNDQSIYSFRGADIEAVLKSRELFDNTKIFVLKRNFRSTEYIVEASRSLISHNHQDIKKDIFTKNEKGIPVLYFNEPNQEKESMRVLHTIMLLIRKYNLDYKDIAVLYRMSYMSRSIEDGLISGGIPYKIIGGTPFFARKEIKDIMSYIRLINNSSDIEAFKRVINTPKRGIGDKNLQVIFDYAQSNDIDILEACKSVKLKGKAAKGLENFNEVINTLLDRIDVDSPADLIDGILNVSGYKDMITEDEKHNDAIERLENIAELKSIASKFIDLDEFIQNISLSSASEDEEEDDNKVQLLTMHSSKGLEFPAVIIVGANEGVNPHWKADTTKAVEEERRLFYVAMTRAEKYLFITRSRLVINRGIMQPQNPSRFIKEINRDYIIDYNNKR